MFLSAVFKGRGTGKVLQEQLPFVLVFRTDKAKPQQEAAEVVFLVDGWVFRCQYPFLLLCQMAERRNEMGVGFDRIGIQAAGEPRE